MQKQQGNSKKKILSGSHGPQLGICTLEFSVINLKN